MNTFEKWNSMTPVERIVWMKSIAPYWNDDWIKSISVYSWEELDRSAKDSIVIANCNME